MGHKKYLFRKKMDAEKIAAQAQEAVQDAVNEAKEAGLEAINDAKEAGLEAFNDAKEAGLEAFNDIKEASLEAFNDAKEGLITSLKNAFKKFGDAIKAKIQALLAKCKGEAPKDESDAGFVVLFIEAAEAIDDAVNGTDDADSFWEKCMEKLTKAADSGKKKFEKAVEEAGLKKTE